jgi:glycosyltransferase involved in cell wall biosynthesis
LINAVHSKSGGGVTYLRNLVPLLAADPELDVHLVIQADQAAVVEPMKSILPVHMLPAWGKLGTVLVQEQLLIPALALRLGAKTVFSPANYGPLLAPAPVILLRNALEVSDLDARLDKRLYWLGVTWLTRGCFATARRVMVVSGHAAKLFADRFHIKEDRRLSVVHHGVGPAFHPGADAGQRTPDRLLAVSDIYVQKNLETLLDALALLPPSVTLDIAGRALDPGYAQALKDRIDRLGIAGRVCFLGGQSAEAVAALYRQASIFVFPSLVETFGNPLVEAMASGIPIVASDAAATPEITDGAALLAHPRDAAHMAEQIARLLGDPALWAEQAAKGLERAQHFSWAETAAKVARVLKDAAH